MIILSIVSALLGSGGVFCWIKSIRENKLLEISNSKAILESYNFALTSLRQEFKDTVDSLNEEIRLLREENVLLRNEIAELNKQLSR